MNESNSIETINRTNLIDQAKFKLNEISKIENYFNQEIKKRKWNSKKLRKYVAAFDYIDRILVFSLQQMREYLLFFLQLPLEPL